MLVLWAPKDWRARHYRVCVRPTVQGEFLVFPFGWRRQGKGYLLSSSLKNRLEVIGWKMYDALAFVLCLGLLWLAFVFGAWVYAGVVVVGAAWGYDLHRRYVKRVEQVLPLARFAGVVLSRKRYMLEYASQYARGELLARLLFCIALSLALTVLAVWQLSRGYYHGGVFSVLGIAVSVWAGYASAKLLGLQHEAFKHGVKAGDVVDMPLPVEGD